ncbi:MAG: spore germination protein [Clostridia bacterium]|nr:spore germination protein [Clostridia bacterium]
MSIKKLLKNMFSYTPPVDYQFRLSEEAQIQEQEIDTSSARQEKVKIFPDLSTNIEFMRTKYNLLINSDIVLREFTMNARGKPYHAFVVYIDGMVNTQIMDDFILKPLMLRNQPSLYDGSQNKIISESISNNITIRKVKKLDLPNYLMSCLIPQNDVKQITDFEEAANAINSRKLCFIC